MAFDLFITEPALVDIGLAADYYEGSGSRKVAERWLDGLDREIHSLANMPRSCPFAPENEDVDFELRERSYKSHRILFTIEGESVYVLRVYHMARRLLDEEGLTLGDG